MKITASIFSFFIAGTITASAFVSPHSHQQHQTSLAFSRSSSSSNVRAPATVKSSSLLKGMSEELDIPCEDECAMTSYPDLPKSVHPGVLSGQAMVDLLNHAKENGTCVMYLLCCALFLCLFV